MTNRLDRISAKAKAVGEPLPDAGAIGKRRPQDPVLKLRQEFAAALESKDTRRRAARYLQRLMSEE